MAEIGLIASVIQVAGAGLTLSKALYQYADSVSSADKRIRDIAQDVKLTSFVIDELGRIFKQDETAALISENAVNTAEETVRECSNVFTEMKAALKKSKKNTLGRLMLPFREPKLELLRTNIDRLKNTLQLLMQVLTHAHQIAAQKPDKEVVAVQRQQIKVLIQTKKESTKRYEESLRNYGSRAMNNDDDLSAEINDEKNETSDRSISMLRTASSIGTTITAKGLESCVEHIQKLLKDIEAVQRALSANIDSTSSTEHEQGLIGSYFRTRSALDSVILGSSSAAKADSGLGEVTLPKIGHLSSVSIEEEREERVRLKKTQTYSKGPEPDPKFDEEKKPLAEKINEEAAFWGQATAAGNLDMDTFVDFNVELLPHMPQINSVSEKSHSRFKQQTGLPPASQVFDPTEEEQYRARGAAEEELLESKKRSEEMSAQISVRNEEKPLAIKFKDAIGRKFSFPFELCKTWKTIEELINQAFLHVDVIGEHVQQGRYDLVGPKGEVILPQLWETVIEPGWEIKMHMWLTPEQPSQSLGPHSRPPQPPQPLDITSPLVVVTTPLANNNAKKAKKAMHPLYMYGSGPRSRRPPSALPQDTRLTDNTAHLASAKQDQEALASQELYYDEDFYQSQNHYESENYYDNGAKEKREKLKAMRDEREKRHQEQGARVEALNQDISPFIRNSLSSAVTLAGEISESDQKIDTSTAFDITYKAPITYDREAENDQLHIQNPGLAHKHEIWKVARATSAAPNYFKEIIIDGYSYTDGAAGHNNSSTPPPGPGLGGTVVAKFSTSEDAAVVSKALDGFEMPRSSGEQGEAGERRRLRVAYKKRPTEAETAALEKQWRGIYGDSMEQLVERPRPRLLGEGGALSGAVPTSQQPPSAPFPEPSVPHAVLVGQEAGTDPAIGLGDVGKEKERLTLNDQAPDREGLAAPYYPFTTGIYDVAPSPPQALQQQTLNRIRVDTYLNSMCNFVPEKSPIPQQNMSAQSSHHSILSPASMSGQRSPVYDRRSSSEARSTSPEAIESSLSPRRGHAYKRVEDPPRNAQNKIICKFKECANLTFERKCEWSKHMDKHDRPYKCHARGCEKLQGFTYSGGLLRHEREVHKLHGGTDKSLFCPHGDCKRSSGFGFTRKDNLAMHIHRVHRRVSASSDTGLSGLKREDDRDEVAQVELIAKERSEPPRATAKSKEEWTRKGSERERERELAMARAEEERARAEERQMMRARAEEEVAAQEMTGKVRREWMRKDSETESNSDKDDDVDELLHEWTTLYTV